MNFYSTQGTSIILSKTIEKSTVAFSCNIKFLDLQKAINWAFLRSNSQNGQSVRRNSFGLYVLCYEFHLAFRSLSFTHSV